MSSKWLSSKWLSSNRISSSSPPLKKKFPVFLKINCQSWVLLLFDSCRLCSCAIPSTWNATFCPVWHGSALRSRSSFSCSAITTKEFLRPSSPTWPRGLCSGKRRKNFSLDSMTRHQNQSLRNSRWVHIVMHEPGQKSGWRVVGVKHFFENFSSDLWKKALLLKKKNFF